MDLFSQQAESKEPEKPKRNLDTKEEHESLKKWDFPKISLAMHVEKSEQRQTKRNDGWDRTVETRTAENNFLSRCCFLILLVVVWKTIGVARLAHASGNDFLIMHRN